MNPYKELAWQLNGGWRGWFRDLLFAALKWTVISYLVSLGWRFAQ
jgi:hypothetical protein